jgi:hypothetical protein
MSDAEIKRRKKVQGHVSQVTGGLGLAALGGTLAASRGGRNALRKLPQLKGKIKAPPPKDPNRDKIKGAVTPVLATSAGLGGIGSFNFAAYTNAESRKKNTMLKKQPVKKDFSPSPFEDGMIGEEGFAKAWSATATDYDPEVKRRKRLDRAETGTVAAAGVGGAATAGYGMSTASEAKKIRRVDAVEVSTAHDKNGTKVKRAAPVGQKFRAVDLADIKRIKKPGAKTAGALALTGGAVAANRAIRRKKNESWGTYSKSATSAFGVLHD